MKKSIDIEGYTLEPELHSNGRFVVFKKTIVSKGKTAGKETRRALGYGMTLQRAIDMIAEDAVWTEEKHLFLNEYLEEKLEEINKVSYMVVEAFKDALKKQSETL